MSDDTRKFDIKIVTLDDSGEEVKINQEGFVYWQVGQFLAEVLMADNLVSFKVERNADAY